MRVFRIVPGEQVAGLLTSGEGASPGEAAWDRRAGESERAYQAFRRYRDLEGRRSLSRVAGGLHGGDRARPWGRLTRWSREWDWVRRAQAWDGHRLRAQQEAERWEEARRLDRQLRRLGRMVVTGCLRTVWQKVLEGELDRLPVVTKTVSEVVDTPKGKRVRQRRVVGLLSLLPAMAGLFTVCARVELEMLGREMRARTPRERPRA